MMEMSRLQFAEAMLAFAEPHLITDPDMTLAQWVEELRKARDEVRNAQQATTVACVNCSRPTAVMGDRRRHLGPDGKPSNIGCRAASFDWLNGEGWDDSLSGNATAPKVDA